MQTVPVVCMHCEQPTCAEVCPADAIKRTGDGVVQSARKPRCIACGNCVLACPFGVPEVYEDRQIMMKCDMCYDRTSVGKKPMCATVCPSQALFFGTREQIEQLRPLSTPVNRFQFGAADDHDAGVHDGAAAGAARQPHRGCHRRDGREAACPHRCRSTSCPPLRRRPRADDPFAEVEV